jgi:Ca2+-binding EF-hand superfamily protein
LGDFLSGFEGAKGNRDGIVTKGEFVDYYTDLSMSLVDDRHFVAMMESAWCIAEDEEAGVFKEQIVFLTKTLREKLRTLSNKTSDEYILRGLFKDFDSNGNGVLTIDELGNMFAKL